MKFDSRYSRLDRITHRLAFSNRSIQATAMDLEVSLYGRRFRDLPVRSPVFVTSLPRAGTTLLLDILSTLPRVATHNYRDMPFVLAPVLWNALSRPFRKGAAETERAHGDGMLVGYDSPEAFEEVIWRYFWPEHFADDRILTWKDDDDPGEFEPNFVQHIRKILALRLGSAAAEGRYVSKNNANIARIGFLRQMIPDCQVVVPFRHPIEQARSLLRQHQRFLTIHLEEPFSRRYMDDIGHWEFGSLHRPIAFPNLDSDVRGLGPDDLNYWVGYWVAAFRHVLRHRNDIICVSYENMCAEPDKSLDTLLSRLEFKGEDLPREVRTSLRPPRPAGDSIGVTSQVLEAATELYQHLLDQSIV